MFLLWLSNLFDIIDGFFFHFTDSTVYKKEDVGFFSKIHKKKLALLFFRSFKNKGKTWLVQINRNLMYALTFKNKITTWLVKFSYLKINKAKVWK